MKRILYLAVSLLFVTSFMSCEKDLETKGISKITYFPDITVQGAATVNVNLGGTYVDPGVVVTENGTPIPYTTQVVGKYFGYTGETVNTAIADVYEVQYTAVNKDGYAKTNSRVVIVNPPSGDLVSSLEGWYTANVKRAPSQGAVPATKDLNYIMVSKIAPDTYGISCGIGGYYSIGRSYGHAYDALGAKITYSGGVFSAGPNYPVGAFGGSTTMSNIIVDPVAKTIVFTASWDGGPYIFTVTLKQVTL